MIAGYTFDCVIADKGYDADAFLEVIWEAGAAAVIPRRGPTGKSVETTMPTCTGSDT